MDGIFKETAGSNGMQRVVSLLPSATEILYELGVGDQIFGVTHECNRPPEAAAKPQVIRSVIYTAGMTSSQINAAIYKLLNRRQDIFRLDEENLKTARPDLIISQETCKACAAHAGNLEAVLDILPKRPKVHSMDPRGLSDILDSVTKLGDIMGVVERAGEVTRALRSRIDRIAGVPTTTTTATLERPRVLAIEWIEPLFTAGHWIPEMVGIAGGQNMISVAGEYSRQMGMSEVARADPDIIVMMPCGFDTERTITEYSVLKGNEEWRSLRAVREGMVFAVDANSFFSKSGIRTIDGLEILAKIIRPDHFPDIEVPACSYVRLS